MKTGDKVYCYESFFHSTKLYDIINDDFMFKYKVSSPVGTEFLISRDDVYKPENLNLMLEKMKNDYDQLEYDIEQVQKMIDKNTELNDDIRRNKNRRLKK